MEFGSSLKGLESSMLFVELSFVFFRFRLFLLVFRFRFFEGDVFIEVFREYETKLIGPSSSERLEPDLMNEL